VESHGHLTSPRKLPASAVYDVTIQIADPVKAPPVGVRLGYAPAIGATETMHLLAGTSSLGQLDAASHGGFSRFADRGRLRGAYGPRLYAQLPRVEKQLRADQATRQAIATLWSHEEDVTTKDVPCTVYLLFRVVEDKLELKVHMRSNDLVLGVPYDWFMFSRLQLVMAEVLGIRPGAYVHHVDNLHVYQRDEERADSFTQHAIRVGHDGAFGLADQLDSVFTNGGHHRFNSWIQVQTAAMSVLYGSDSAYRRFRWYHGMVTPLKPEQIVCCRCQYIFTPDQGLMADLFRNVCYECTGEAA
jgi:hypothetical protein